MVINELDCNIESLTTDDFPDVSLETASYVMEQIQLNRTASQVFFRHCSPARLPLYASADTRRRAKQEISTTLRAWHEGLPRRFQKERGHHLYLTLEMCYYFLEISLQQRLQSHIGESDMAHQDQNPVLEAANSITRLAEDAMMYWSPDYFPMMWVTALFAAMNIQFVSYRTLNEQGRETILAKLRTSLIALKQFEEYYILARWLRILWNDIFDRWGGKPTNQRIMTPPHLSTRLSPTDECQIQNPVVTQPLADSGPTSQYSQAGGLDYGSEWLLEANPYLTADWSNLVFPWNYEADLAMGLTTPHFLDSEGLQFPADSGRDRHHAH